MIDKKLQMHYDSLKKQSLKTMVAEQSDRFDQFSIEAAGLFIDFSKNWITPETRSLLCDFAREKQLAEKIKALLSGKNVNQSENRAALHTALRLPKNTTFLHANKDIAQEMQTIIDKMAHYATLLAEKKWCGVTGKPIDTIIHVGVGGSGLGPALYAEALVHLPRYATAHFITDFDFECVQNTLAACDPEKTAVIIVSKSFGTEETLTIFDTICAWLKDKKHIEQHCFAVTANVDRAKAKGFLEAHILPFWDFVGGRYSLWSAVNFVNVLTFGLEAFQQFLAGAHEMDQHFQTAPFEKNMPVMSALLAFGYNNFFHAYSKAIVPYSTALARLPSYLQQLCMESLGKSVNNQGEKIDYPTGQVIWGEVGPSSQHSFHQLLMQGSQMIPVDFILPFTHQTLNDYDLKRAAYCLSQSETLLNGCEGDAHQMIEGNRPSTTFLIRHFSPKTLGALLAFYEHQVYVLSVLWDINAFDQWGVERGKVVAKTLLAEPAPHQSVSGLWQKIKSL